MYEVPASDVRIEQHLVRDLCGGQADCYPTSVMGSFAAGRLPGLAALGS